MSNTRQTLSLHRVRAAVLLLVVFVLFSTTRTLFQSGRGVTADDDVSTFIEHMQSVRPFLPRNGTIGYVSNLTDAATFFKMYMLTQYVLAPLVVTNIGAAPNSSSFGTLSPAASPPSSNIVIGVFTDEVPPSLLNQQHLIVVQRFENGIVLLRKDE